MIENFVKHISDKNQECVIFDIGSRDCIQSIEFYHTFPNARIYVFECNQNTLPICRKNIEPYSDRITLVEGSICDYDGEITFYPINQNETVTTWEDGNPGASSLFKSNGKYEHETYVQDEIKTNCHRLDSVMKKHNIPKVDIIWMDLQGAELLVLKGLGDYLNSVNYIHTKACFKPIYENQALFPEINNYLCNFFCFDLLNNINMEDFFSDAIYKNRFLKDPIFSKIDLTFDEQTNIRGKPKKYLLHAIDLFKNYTNAKIILEIGSIRQKMNHNITDFNPSCCNDGHSTYFWKNYTNAEVYTVDIDPHCKYIIDNDTRLKGVNSYSNDAFEFVKDFNKSIDLLFLDAWDVVPGSPYDVAHLNIYNELKLKLSDSCVILIDDTDVGDGGKGKLIIPQLQKDGFTMITNKRQTIFVKNNK
jgi:FkbM family methyltransferase